ncbi:MAG: hypothetical protein IT486_01395 [Gammaproteobacteria bacterium]|nr:hypothetical protein [Gammaproteobacteria bacterium]
MAVPRQQELNASTRRGSVEALGESVRSAAQFGHALWEAQGGPAALQVTRGRVAIINGYPAPGDVALLLETPETMGFAGRGGHWQHEAVDATRGCGLSYAPPTAMGSVPRVTLHLDGC